jgi:hypothetical protein
MTRPETEPTALVSHIDERSQTWHERLRHLNFQSLQSMETQKMVVGLPKVFPLKESVKVVCLESIMSTF